MECTLSINMRPVVLNTGGCLYYIEGTYIGPFYLTFEASDAHIVYTVIKNKEGRINVIWFIGASLSKPHTSEKFRRVNHVQR